MAGILPDAPALAQSDGTCNGASDRSCGCGAAQRILQHVVNDCPLTKFDGASLQALHSAESDNTAVVWFGR